MEKVKNKTSSLTDDFEEELFYNREEFINQCSKDIGMEEAKKEIAKNMLNKSFDLNVIAEITGLKEKEINELKEK